MDAYTSHAHQSCSVGTNTLCWRMLAWLSDRVLHARHLGNNRLSESFQLCPSVRQACCLQQKFLWRTSENSQSLQAIKRQVDTRCYTSHNLTLVECNLTVEWACEHTSVAASCLSSLTYVRPILKALLSFSAAGQSCLAPNTDGFMGWGLISTACRGALDWWWERSDCSSSKCGNTLKSVNACDDHAWWING